MRKIISSLISFGILAQALILSPSAFAKSTLTDQEIIQQYSILMNSANRVADFNQITEKLAAAGVNKSRILNAFKRSLIKNNPEVYAEMNEKIQSVQQDPTLSSEQKRQEMDMIAHQTLAQAEQTGLAFSSHYADGWYILVVTLIVVSLIVLAIHSDEVYVCWGSYYGCGYYY